MTDNAATISASRKRPFLISARGRMEETAIPTTAIISGTLSNQASGTPDFFKDNVTIRL
ncbi:MAG TPA: hypothetical protein VIA98_13130 [Allosphingosinicella sp.]